MPFPRRLLIEGEELILDLRPHPVALVRAVVVTILIIIAWAFLLPNIGDEGFWGTVGWIVIVAGVVILIWWPIRDTIRFLTSNFAVTSDRIIHRQGFIAKSSMEIPLEAINDVRFKQNVFERMINSGDLVISSASEQGREVFKDIRDPESVQKTIYHQGELNKQRMMSGGGARAVQPPPSQEPTQASQPQGSVADELAKLDKLRADGVISEEEFAAQKAKVLGGS